MKARVEVVEQILSANDQLAVENRRAWMLRMFALNMMASPGAGKTSLIEPRLRG